MQHLNRTTACIVIVILLLGTPAFSGTWVPYEYDNSNSPTPVGNAEKMSSSAGATYTEANLKADVLKLLGIGWPVSAEDGTASCQSDCTIGMRVIHPCTVCYSYAWSGSCQIGQGSQISAEASAFGWFTGAWGSSQGACIVYGDLTMKDKDAIAVDDEGSGAQVEIGWPASFKIKTEKAERTNDSDQEPFAGNDSSKGQGTEVQVRYRGYSKVKGHAEASIWSPIGSHVVCTAMSDIVTIITLKGFRAPGVVIIDMDIAVPVNMVTFARGVTLYDVDQGLPPGAYPHSKATGPKPVLDLDEPPQVPEERNPKDFETPDDWTD